MTITDYQNFDVLITQSGEQYRAFLVHAPAGDDDNWYELPFTPDEVKRLGGLGLGAQQAWAQPAVRTRRLIWPH